MNGDCGVQVQHSCMALDCSVAGICYGQTVGDIVVGKDRCNKNQPVAI